MPTLRVAAPCSAFLAIAVAMSCGGGGADENEDTPIANAGAAQEVAVGTLVTLDGSRSQSPSGAALGFFWTIVSTPEGSAAALSAADVPEPTFTPDREGIYKIQLEVDDGKATSAPDTVSIRAHAASRPFDYLVIDAEYHRVLDRIVAVSDAPASLHVIDPASSTETAIALGMAPNSVSVHPSLPFAAVGHDGKVSYLDLSTGRLVNQFDAGVKLNDVVLAANGYVYAFPEESISGALIGIEIETGAKSESSKAPWGGGNGKLHPGGQWIYASNAWHSEVLEKYDIGGGAPVYLYDIFGTHDYKPWGGHWFIDDGSRIVTRGATVVHVTGTEETDMAYAGELGELSTVMCAAHHKAVGQIAVVPGGKYPSREPDEEDAEVQIFNASSYAFVRSAGVPPLREGAATGVAHARFLFYDNAGAKLYVISHGDEESTLAGRSGLATLDAY